MKARDFRTRLIRDMIYIVLAAYGIFLAAFGSVWLSIEIAK